MRERLKTFVLISLVSISIFLTKRLWIEVPNDMFKIFQTKDKAISASYLISDMIIPHKYLLNFHQKNHTILYEDEKYGLWNNTKSSLINILGSKVVETFEISEEEYMDYHNLRSIVFYFPEEISTYIMAKALDVKNPKAIGETISEIKSIYVYLDKGDPFFIFSSKDKHILVSNESINNKELAKQFSNIESSKDYSRYYFMKDIGIDNILYMPYEMKTSLPRIYVENEINTLTPERRAQLAERFFNKNSDYISEIVENNGSTIYIYNQRVLKLNANGTLEYFHGLEENIRQRNLYQSLNTVADFISENIGVPKGMYLSGVEEIEAENSEGYRFNFKYMVRGIPVILGNTEVEDFIEIDVFNNHVRRYKHFVRKEMNKGLGNILDNQIALSSYDVIDMNDDYLKKKYIEDNNLQELVDQRLIEDEELIEKVLASISDISLAYFDPYLKDKEDSLIGIWVIEMGDRIFAFDVYNGTLVFEQN